MPTIIDLPQVGESVTEGIISKWLRGPGDRVEKYDPLVEVMTDKVNMEVPSPYTGTLTRILAPEGETVPMGAPIAEMEVEGVAPVAPAGADAEHRRRVGEFMESVRSVGPTGSGEGGQGLAATPTPAPARPRAAQPAALGVSGPGEATTSPVVRRLVQQHGVDLSQVRGTGMGGRVTKEDLLQYVASRRGGAPGAPAPLKADEEAVALTPLRKAIAEHMARSAREAPVAWTMVEVDVTGLAEWREARKEEFQRDQGAPLTHLCFVAHEVAQALLAHPRLNARWGGDQIIQSRRVHLGIATATPDGLMVPVVHDADKLSVTEMATRIYRLAQAARAQKLRLEDVQGGTFTINNTGALGSVMSAPIVNHPQVAILTTEAVVKRPVVVQDTIAIRSMMNVCLAFDHRVCDGADAAAFLNGVKARLEAITAQMALE